MSNKSIGDPPMPEKDASASEPRASRNKSKDDRPSHSLKPAPALSQQPHQSKSQSGAHIKHGGTASKTSKTPSTSHLDHGVGVGVTHSKSASPQSMSRRSSRLESVEAGKKSLRPSQGHGHGPHGSHKIKSITKSQSIINIKKASLQPEERSMSNISLGSGLEAEHHYHHTHHHDKRHSHPGTDSVSDSDMSPVMSTVKAEISGVFNEFVVPQELVDELYDEDRVRGLMEGSSLYELFDQFTESGTAIKMYRRVSREDENDLKNFTKTLRHAPQVQDVTGGGMTRTQLERFSRERLRDLVADISFQLEYYKAENLILDNTVQSLEKREMEIEKDLPIFKFTIGASRGAEGEKVTEKVTDDVCEDDLSSDEENLTSVFEPFIPKRDIDENDEYFANMSEKSKLALQEYFQQFTEVGPSNYDPFLHRYGDLIRPQEEEVLKEKASRIRSQATHLSIGGGAPKNLPDHIVEDDSLKTEENSTTAFLHDKMKADPHEYGGIWDEEDPEFPDFVQRLAKTLPVHERLKYGRKEEDTLRSNYEKIENREIVKANKIIVYTDTYMKSFKLLKTISDMLQRTMKNGYHPMTGRIKAEDILRFRRRMKNIILAEETKMRMVVNEYRKRKNKVDRQVRDNRELGESIQAIDYEQLRISNLQYQHKIDEQHEILKQLKLITASQLDRLKLLKHKVHKKVILHANIVGDIQVRSTLKKHFEKNFTKHNDSYKSISNHNTFLKKRLRQFQAPGTLEYINYKKLEQDLEDDVKDLQTKIKSVKIMLGRAQMTRRNYDKTFPAAEVRRQNAEWLKGIKDEVRAKRLHTKYMPEILRPMGGSLGKFIGNAKAKEREAQLRLSIAAKPRETQFTAAPRKPKPSRFFDEEDSAPRQTIFASMTPHEDVSDDSKPKQSVVRASVGVEGAAKPRITRQLPRASNVLELPEVKSPTHVEPEKHFHEPRPSISFQPRISQVVEEARRFSHRQSVSVDSQIQHLPAAPPPSLQKNLVRRKTLADIKSELATEMRDAEQTLVKNF